MNIFNRLAIVAVVGSLLALPVGAQETAAPLDSPKRAAILRLMERMGVKENTERMWQQMLAQMRQGLTQVPEEFFTEFTRRARPEELIERTIPIYDRHFTQEEIDGLIAFYETPLGKKLVGELPAITQESMQIGSEWGRQKAQEALAEIERRRPAPSSSKPTTKARPKAGGKRKS